MYGEDVEFQSTHHGKQIIDKTHEWADKFNQKFGSNLKINKVRFFKNKSRVAAYAYFLKREIKYNSNLIPDNFDGFIQTIVPHEVAHLVAYKLYGSKGMDHGPPWRNLLEEFRVSSSPYHKFDTTNVGKKSRFNYALKNLDTNKVVKFYCRRPRNFPIDVEFGHKGGLYICRSLRKAL